MQGKFFIRGLVLGLLCWLLLLLLFGKFRVLPSTSPKKKKYINVIQSHIHLIPQLMDSCLVGARGQLVPKPVNPGLKLDQGAARRLSMVENHVHERHENSGCATGVYVQVRKLLC